jgi:RNA polymerase sigma factor (sigma-70 family)
MTATLEGMRLPAVDSRERAFGVAGGHSAAASVVLDLEANHGQALFGFVRRQGLTDDQAADAVQEVLARLLDQLMRGVQIDKPRAWAYRAIYRLAMDEYRLRRRISALFDLLTRTQESVAGPEESDRIAVWAAVDRLPTRQRQVLYLRYRSDLTFEEIGAVLEITASAARSHATQALAALRRQLHDREES